MRWISLWSLPLASSCFSLRSDWISDLMGTVWCERPFFTQKFMGESLLTSLFTFFLISIRLNSKKPWPEIWTKCKSWKSWLSWAICAIFSLLKAILKELQLRNCWVAKKVMSHTFFVKFRVFKREFLRNDWVYRAQIFRDNWNCYALSIFRCFILFASSDNDEHMLMRQKG